MKYQVGQIVHARLYGLRGPLVWVEILKAFPIDAHPVLDYPYYEVAVCDSRTILNVCESSIEGVAPDQGPGSRRARVAHACECGAYALGYQSRGVGHSQWCPMAGAV